jgi:hypothetical protein
VERPFSVAGDRAELEPHVSDQMYPGRLRRHCVDGVPLRSAQKTNGNGSRSFPQRLAGAPRIPPATGAPPPVERNAASSHQPHKQQRDVRGNLPDCRQDRCLSERSRSRQKSTGAREHVRREMTPIVSESAPGCLPRSPDCCRYVITLFSPFNLLTQHAAKIAQRPGEQHLPERKQRCDQQVDELLNFRQAPASIGARPQDDCGVRQTK